MGTMEINVPEKIRTIGKTISDAGFEVYAVGGAVRDSLLGRQHYDWDLTTNATPEEIQKLFPESFYKNTYGTVSVPLEDEHVVEITTFRSEKGYSNKRHPDEVTWGKSLDEDLERRDFTVNAMALPLPVIQNGEKRSEESSNVGGAIGSEDSTLIALNDNTIIDPFVGQKDLDAKLIRAVGNPTKRFGEDALRMMRAIRFATQLSFTIEPHTLSAIKENAELITHVSGERIRDELFKILASDYAYDGLMLLRNATLLQYIMPELDHCFGVSQIGPNRHHIYDVGTHNFYALKFCPSKDPLVRFAALIHDIGKPLVLGQDNRGNPTFYNHEVVGATIARNIADRLHLSKEQRKRLVSLVRWHQFSVDDIQTDSAVRRFIRNVGVENIQDQIDVRIGDRLGSGIPEHNKEGWRLQKFKERIEKELNPPFAIKDLAVSGDDVMEILEIKPGPKVGQVLQTLFEEVDEDLSKNDRDYLLEKIRGFQE